MARGAIFIGYRRDDTADVAGRIYNALAARLGPSSVFKHVDNTPLGDNFGEHIKGILPLCRAALIVIGPEWAKDRSGRRRLNDPRDRVRIEIERALAGDLNVVPVLVNGAGMPRTDEVPPSLHPLLGRHAAIIRAGSGSRRDIERLVRSLARVIVPEMVPIPAGEFMMGQRGEEEGDNQPQHLAQVKAFELGKYPVTFAEWNAANAAGALLGQPKAMGWGRDRHPVINVSWHAAQTYIAWLNSGTSGGYRLPSEAEWEYACRAGTTTFYSTGTSISAKQARFQRGSTSPVGSCAANAFGLFDMHGNVSEWVEDAWHEDYNGAPSDGSAWTEGGDTFSDTSLRVIRGGSYYDYPHMGGSANRSAHYANLTLNYVGFRVARTVKIVSL